MLRLTSFYSSKRMRRMWVLDSDKIFKIGDVKILVPKGYWFDGSSVPRVFWAFAPPTGKAFEASCLHDWLYDTKGLIGQYSRKTTDRIFLNHMKIDNVNKIQRYLFYIVVRLFGSIYWKKDSMPNVYLKSTDHAKINH